MPASTESEKTVPPPPVTLKVVFQNIFRRTSASQTSLSAAGCAFYATLSLFPALTALISLYGLAFDLQTVEPQLEVLRHLLPISAYSLIVERIHTLVSQPHSSLTLGLVFSVIVALWSATASSRSIISALNLAYRTKENRGFLQFQFLAFSTTFMAVIGACMTLSLMVAAPALVDIVPRYLQSLGMTTDHVPPVVQFWVSRGTPLVIDWAGPILMLLFAFAAISMLYRFAPCRQWTCWRWVAPGAVVSTLLWVLLSLGFSWYVSHFAGYSATYGPLGAVAAVMMWFFVSGYVVLFGAVMNAELEEQGKRKILRREMGLPTCPEDPSGVT